MKIKTVVVTLAILLITLAASPLIAQDTANLVKGNNQFAFDLYKQLAKQEGNLFFSPYSISSCLGMVYTGANGQTAQEMRQALHYGTPLAALPRDFELLQKALAPKEARGPQLEIANGLWVQKDHPFLPGYLQSTKEHFAAEINQADFQSEAEPTRLNINSWVSNRTHEKIQNLLSPGIIHPLTKMILVNAVYFKGQWQTPFDKNATLSAKFHVSKDKSISSLLMNKQSKFPYLETDQLQLISLPYSCSPLSMVILLPKDTTNFKDIESSLSAKDIDSWLSQARLHDVNLYLPRFRSTSQFSLNDTLVEMGMPTAFTYAADFSGMDGACDLFISAVIHKAYVDVYEEGTEATAATAICMDQKCIMMQPEKPLVFRADHPFIYLLRDNNTGSILFLGRMMDPSL